MLVDFSRQICPERDFKNYETQVSLLDTQTFIPESVQEDNFLKKIVLLDRLENVQGVVITPFNFWGLRCYNQFSESKVL